MIASDSGATPSAPQPKPPAAAPVAAKPSPTVPDALSKLATLFKTDPKKESEGAWMTIATGVRWKIRSDQSDESREVTKALLRDHKAQLAAGASFTKEQNEDYELNFCALALVTDWEGMDEGGQKMACTELAIRRVLKDLPRLRALVMQFAGDMQNYRPDAK